MGCLKQSKDILIQKSISSPLGTIGADCIEDSLEDWMTLASLAEDTDVTGFASPVSLVPRVSPLSSSTAGKHIL